MEQNASDATKMISAKGDRKQLEVSTANSAAFVNTGLERWEKVRAQWVNQSGAAAAATTTVQSRNGCCMTSESNNRDRNGVSAKRNGGAVDLNVDDIIDLIVSNRWRITSDSQSAKNKAKFSQAVPLPQMVDILVDLWEAEGLDV